MSDECSEVKITLFLSKYSKVDVQVGIKWEESSQIQAQVPQNVFEYRTWTNVLGYTQALEVTCNYRCRIIVETLNKHYVLQKCSEVDLQDR